MVRNINPFQIINAEKTIIAKFNNWKVSMRLFFHNFLSSRTCVSIVSRIMSIIFICFGFVSVPTVDYYAAEDVDDYSPARCVELSVVDLFGFGVGVWGIGCMYVFCFCSILFVWAGRGVRLMTDDTWNVEV